MGRVRGRSGKGTAKIEAPGGNASVGGGPFDGPLTIRVDAEDPSVTTQLLDDNTMKLMFYQPTFKPFAAIRSLVRACWLGLTEPQRADHGMLRGFIKGSVDPTAKEGAEDAPRTGSSRE